MEDIDWDDIIRRSAAVALGIIAAKIVVNLVKAIGD